MTKRKVVTSSQKQKMSAMYVLGDMTYREIADFFPGLSYQIVSRVLKAEGVRIRTGTPRYFRRKKFSHAWDVYDDVVRMYQEGQSTREIAKKVGCSMMPIRAILIDAGEIRTYQEAWVHRRAKPKPKKAQPHTIKREAGLEDVQVSKRAGVAELYEQGILIDKIAELKGMTRVEVYQMLQKQGVL